MSNLISHAVIRGTVPDDLEEALMEAIDQDNEESINQRVEKYKEEKASQGLSIRDTEPNEMRQVLGDLDQVLFAPGDPSKDKNSALRPWSDKTKKNILESNS